MDVDGRKMWRRREGKVRASPRVFAELSIIQIRSQVWRLMFTHAIVIRLETIIPGSYTEGKSQAELYFEEREVEPNIE
jgi:hypothetical protein